MQKVKAVIWKLKWVILAVIVLAVAALFFLKPQPGELYFGDFLGKYEMVIVPSYELRRVQYTSKTGEELWDTVKPARDIIQVTDKEAKSGIKSLLSKIESVREYDITDKHPYNYQKGTVPTEYYLCNDTYFYVIMQWPYYENYKIGDPEVSDDSVVALLVRKLKIVDKDYVFTEDGGLHENVYESYGIVEGNAWLKVADCENSSKCWLSVISREDYEKLEALSTGLAEDQYTVLDHIKEYDPSKSPR